MKHDRNNKYLDFLYKLKEQTARLNKEDNRRGTLLIMPGVTEDEAHSPLISAERHARIPMFQYFLKYIRALKEDQKLYEFKGKK